MTFSLHVLYAGNMYPIVETFLWDKMSRSKSEWGLTPEASRTGEIWQSSKGSQGCENGFAKCFSL